MRGIRSVTGFLLILSMLAWVRPVFAVDGERERPVRLYATATVGPAGFIANSLGDVSRIAVNGRTAAPGAMIWSGDVVQTGSRRDARIVLEAIGHLRVKRDSVIRIATSTGQSYDGTSNRVLIASLFSGAFDIELNETAGAHVESIGDAFSASPGSNFSVEVRHGRSMVSVKTGSVKAEPQVPRPTYKIEPVGHGDRIALRAGEIRYIRVRVSDDDRPVADVPVTFTVGDSSGRSVGTLGMGTLAGTVYRGVTNADGVASVAFLGGQTPGTAPINALIEGTRTSWMGEVTVDSERWTPKNKALVIAAAVAAIAGASVAVAKLNDKDPLKLEPPVIKNP